MLEGGLSDPASFPLSAFTHETFASVQIDVMDAYNIKLGTGTGFIGKFGKNYYLITALHVLLGLSSADENNDSSSRTARFINTNCFIVGRKDGRHYMENRALLLELYSSSRDRIWNQLFNWDVATINITDRVTGDDLAPIAIDLSEVAVEVDENGLAVGTTADDDMPPVGSDIFIVGYPGNLSYITQDRAPLWKRASIASEPHLNIDERPIFLVDTQGASGLSGSPVLYNGSILVSPLGLRRHCSYEHAKFRLVGIYCGREGYAPDAISLSMGRVFKISAIQHTIMEPRDD